MTMLFFAVRKVKSKVIFFIFGSQKSLRKHYVVRI